MWDLETIQRMNDQAYVAAMRITNGDVLKENNSSPEQQGASIPVDVNPVYPLSILALKLMSGPPSIAYLYNLIVNSEYLSEFRDLVMEYLPEHEVDILNRVTDTDKIGRFCVHFQNKYFPLTHAFGMWGEEEYTIADFLSFIPVELYGFTYEDFEEFNSFRPGLILMLSLVETPFEDEGRISLLEAVKEMVGKKLVEMIPSEGWSPRELHEKLDETEYEGCALFADWIHSETGCWQLDTNHLEWEMEAWDSYIVNTLAEQWPTVVNCMDKMDKMYAWLENDQYYNFEKLLSFITGEEIAAVPDGQLPLLPLDQDEQKGGDD